MKYHFCTLFDRNYLYKGLALHSSLIRHCPDFTLWILCMDELTFTVLEKLRLEKAVLIRAEEFEDEELQKAKQTRTVAEYCWTCTPSLPWYVLQKNPSLDMITYLDADLFFYDDPSPIYEEMGNNSVLIIEHRFPEHLKDREVNGIYNVSIVAFRNNPEGLECLSWWRDRCNEWCYYRLEDGKMGDQKYLDDWPTRFKGVHVLQHKGAGVALWNIMRYETRQVNGKTFIDEAPLIFYHFHQFHILGEKSYDYGVTSLYSLTRENIRLIYKPYTSEIEKSIRHVRKVDPTFRGGFKLTGGVGFLEKLRNRARMIRERIGCR